MTKKIFVSLPMHGHTDEEIRKRMNDIYELAMNVFNESCELINTMWEEPSPNPDNPIWYLGKSIQVLGEADLVIFASGWAMAKGCVIERCICDIYSIERFNEEDLWDLQELKYKLQEMTFDKNDPSLYFYTSLNDVEENTKGGSCNVGRL